MGQATEPERPTCRLRGMAIPLSGILFSLSPPSPLMSPSVTGQTTGHHAIRDLLRAPAPATLGPRRRAPPAHRRPRAGRAGRPARHRLPVGSGAPLQKWRFPPIRLERSYGKLAERISPVFG